MHNGGVNYRFRAVRFPIAVNTDGRVPGFLANSVIFDWPAQQKGLFGLIFDDPSLEHRQKSVASVNSGVSHEEQVVEAAEALAPALPEPDEPPDHDASIDSGMVNSSSAVSEYNSDQW